MKLETNGVMTLKNINLLNNDFLAKITTLGQEVNVLQQTLGTATQDIGGLQQQINVINEELNRQTHFRGYYLLSTDIQNLPNSANRDFAFSAESGTVWMYDAAWYNSGDIVPDQVTPASDATPLADSGTGVAGTSNEYSRGDHKHPLQVSDVLSSKDTSVGTVGQASSYARSDHQNPTQTVDTIPVSDSADGSYGTVDSYARNDHSYPINVQTNDSIIPIVNGQLTYDGNVKATKFIKSGGLSTQLLLANGDTTTDFVTKATTQTITDSKTFNNYVTAAGYKIPNRTNQDMLMADGSTKPFTFAEQEFYITGSIEYIKLCMFGAYTTPTDVSVEFTCKCRTGFGLIYFNQVYTSDGIGTYQYKLQSNMSIGMDVCYIIYFGTCANRYGELWARVLMWSNKLIFQQTNQGMETEPLMDVLNNAMQSQLPSGASSSTALLANQFNSVVHISSSLNDN
ncbi:MAG: hypothetical protein EZS28_017004 [Streblomastix strix]|uniref:Uncharacterized protein n=1 Tax=Streblomastix strix TaxID=222440 RepID=A0A5J4VXV7_9EUKA|nr:MAG: hypothetical protein EZS28_017004 [Streblomastix strix]